MNPDEHMAGQEWQRYLAMFHRRRWLLATCFGLSLAAATVYNYTTRPLYRATAQVLVAAETLDPMPTRRVQRQARNEMARHVRVLHSRALAERVVEKMRLQQTAELRSGPLMSPWERFQRRVLGRAPQTTDEDGLPLSPAAAAFRSRLTITPRPDDVVDVTFVAYDPGIAAEAANTVAQTYITHAEELESSLLEGATGWLNTRLSEQKDLVARAERALADYQEQHGISNVEERLQMLEQKLGTLHGALMGARTERMAKETLYQEMLALSREDLESFPPVRNNAAVAGLRARLSDLEQQKGRLAASLGERHPDMLALDAQLAEAQQELGHAIDAVLKSAANEYRLAQQQEQTFEQSLEPVQDELQALKRSTIEYDFLKREVLANEQLFRNIMSRSAESRLEGDLGSGLELVQSAELPKEPFHPRKLLNYQVAALIGLALGIGLVLVVEQADQTMKTPEDVKEQLGIPFLGLVPDTTRSSKAGPALRSPLILKNPRSALAEAYRVIRTNLIFSAPTDAPGRTMVVSSVNPAEGKSTNVLNIAASLAQNGARVLVIDGDLRRPTLHQNFGIPATPGVSDLVVGKGSPDDAIRATSVDGLFVLPCGYIPPNPSELLGSARMRSVLAELRQKFDWVIVDAPPILAMADAPVLASQVDGLLLVIAAEHTRRAAILRALDQISAVGGSLVGAVLNRVDLQRNSFYFGQHYGEYYTSYYSAGAALAKGADRPPAASVSARRG